MNNIYAIGDIHGCLDKLKGLMEKIDIVLERDQLVFLGDYIDRGPNSYEVVQFLIDLKNKYPKTVFLKGNHEEMLEQYIGGINRLTYMACGGRQTLESYVNQPHVHHEYPIPDSHLDFFGSLDFIFQTDMYIFVHAGLRDRIALGNQKTEDLLWIRERFISSEYDFGKKVVFGHTPFPEPLVRKNKIGIDTGAVYGNRLTCVKLPEMVFFQQ